MKLSMAAVLIFATSAVAGQELSWLKAPDLLVFELDFPQRQKPVAPGVYLRWTFHSEEVRLSSENAVQREKLTEHFYNSYYGGLDPCYLFEFGTALEALTKGRMKNLVSRISRAARQDQISQAVFRLAFELGVGLRKPERGRRLVRTPARGVRLEVEIKKTAGPPATFEIFSGGYWPKDCIDFEDPMNTHLKVDAVNRFLDQPN